MPITKFVDVEATVTPKNTAYDAGDVVGGLITFAIPGAAGGGILNTVHLSEDDNEGAVLTLYLFRASPTAILDDAAFAPAIADLRKLVYVGAIAAADYSTSNSLKFVTIADINNAFAITGGNLYGYLVCTATPTYAATKKIYITLSIITE